MSESLLRELVEKIAHQQLLNQWPMYLLMLALAFIGGAAASYFGSYFKKRGESLATKTDFDNLLIQVKATTIATEEVKSKITHLDWTTKERTILRRTKLEELLLRLHELADWQESKRIELMFNGEQNHNLSPLPKVSLLIVLYFPELRFEIGEYLNLHRKAMILLSDTHLKVLGAKDEQLIIIRSEASTAYLEQYKFQLQALNSIENQCHLIMNQLIS
jgi:hypothetical protein